MIKIALLRNVYEAIEDPRKRTDNFAAFAELIGAKAAAVKVENKQLQWAYFRVTHGMDRSTEDSYCQYYVSLNPWALRGVQNPGEVRTSDELLSEAELHETEFYHEWMKPRGWKHTAAVSLDTTETERTILVAYRPPNHPFTEKETAILKDCAPDFALATRIAKKQWALQNEINRLRSGAAKIDPLKRFNLSPRESLVASSLIQGLTAKEYAAKAGIAESTVRSHVKSIHKKTGVHRRADLTRLLTGQ